MSRPPRLRLAAAGLLAGAAAAVAQPQANRPSAFLHAEPTGGTFDTREKGVALRPNTDQKLFAYVRNPAEDAVPAGRTVSVVLARDADGRQVVARGSVSGLKKLDAVPVPLALVAAPTAAAPAVKPGDPPPAAPVGAVADRLYLLTTTEGEDKQPLAGRTEELAVTVDSPSNYLEPVGEPTFTPDGPDTFGFSITLRDRLADGRPFPGPPAKVRLDIRPALLPGLDPAAPKAGTYEAVVPPGKPATGPGVVLAARKLRFTGPTGVVAVSADGFDRALVYEVGAQGNKATPLAPAKAFARLDLPRYAVPGKPLAVRAEVFQEPAGATPVLSFRRAEGGSPQLLLPAATGLRDERRTVRGDADGGLVFAATVRDWVVPVDTAGVYGERTFRLETAGGPARADERPVLFDDTSPAVRLVGLAASRYVGTKLDVVAEVLDAESPVDPKTVVFFLGEPPAADGKVPPGSEAVTGVPYLDPKAAKGGKPNPNLFTASFLLPDSKGKVKVGVRAANLAGLAASTEPQAVLVVDPPKPKEKRTVGDIAVRVIQGSSPERPQPGLPVELRTAAGALVRAGTTDDKGEAAFKDLPPGAYVLVAVKRADLGARAVAAVSVLADKETAAVLEIKR